MDPLVQEKMRVRTALLEIERQKVKLLMTTEAAKKLHEHARATRADLAIITPKLGRWVRTRPRELNERPESSCGQRPNHVTPPGVSTDR
jgi:hypothetical protein